MESGGGRCTVSATEIVSLRSMRRSATSLTIFRNSSGGNEDDMVLGCLVMRDENMSKQLSSRCYLAEGSPHRGVRGPCRMVTPCGVASVSVALMHSR
jgi:hypothetical protein